MVEVERRIATAPIEYPDTLSSICQDFIGRILKKEPSQRPSIDAILAHPWLTGSLCRVV